MTLNEDAEERLEDLINQLEVVHSQIRKLLRHRDGAHNIRITPKEAKELFKLVDREKELLEELTSVKGINRE